MSCRDEDPDGVLGWLEDKIEAVTLIPRSHGEVSSRGAI